MCLASIRFHQVPIEAWATLPVVILALYAIFRWRKFGENSFTWNHNYFKRAVAFGIGVWAISCLATLAPEYWQRAAIWIAVSIAGILAMDYWGGEGIFPAATNTMLMVLVGVTAMPLPKAIGHFIYGDFEPDRRPAAAEIPTRHFMLHLLPGWQTIPGKPSRTYRSSRAGSGFFQLSMHPPLEGRVDGARAEKELDSMLGEMTSEMKFGRRLEIGRVSAKSGPLAFAKYQSDEHGTLGFWLLPGEAMIFATYVDGGSTASAADIREAQQMLQAAQFQ